MSRIILLALFVCCSVVAFCQQGQQKAGQQSRPFIIGETVELTSAVLSEKRTLNIYLPPDYQINDTARYPVIYLLDGSADEDFIHIAGLVQFSSFPWVARLPQSIVVGIANVDRKRDFTFPTTIAEDRKLLPTAGGSARFMDFIEKELQPFIERTYRSAGTRTLIGESLGGLLATEFLLKRPALFQRYIIVSPSLWWDDGSLLRQPVPRIDSLAAPAAVYIGVGKEGLTPGHRPHVMEVDANLLSDKLRKSGNKNLTVHFDYLPEEDHATIGHHAVLNAFRVLSQAPGTAVKQ